MSLKADWVNGDDVTTAYLNALGTTVNGLLTSATAAGANLIVDGGYTLGAGWWATEVARTGITLSTTVAWTGTTSLRMAGGAQRTHYPNVTSAGGDGSTTKLAATFGQVFEISLRVYRPAANGDTGTIWGGCHFYGASGSDYDTAFSVNQVDIPDDTWTTIRGTVAVPYTGTYAPYADAVPFINTNTGSGDNLYLDTVRVLDITSSTPSLVAPPPTGNRTVDTANLQALVDRAQTTYGTVLLRAGVYAADIVTKRTRKQPRIVGQGKQATFIDGTIKMQGDHVNAEGNFSGGWLEGFTFTGSHPAAVALEINGGSHMRGKELRVKGTYGVGLQFHNEQTNEYTEQSSFAIDIGETCDIAVHYKVTSGAQSSFAGCGLELGSVIEGNNGGDPLILIDTDARPYNAPMDAHVWVVNDDAPIFQHNGEISSNFCGNLTVEAIGNGVPPNGTGALIAYGNPLYFGGGLTTYIASGSGAIDYGTFRLMNNVAAVGGVSQSMTPGPTTIGDIYGNTGHPVLKLDDAAGSTNYLRIANSNAGRPTISTLGASTDIDLQFLPKGAGGLQIFMASGSSTFLEATGSAANVDLILYTKGAGTVQANGNPVGVKVAVPSTATSTGVQGQWAADASYHYTCTATNTWRRVAHVSW